MTLQHETSPCSQGIEKQGLNQSILSVLSREEILRGLRMSCTVYENLQSIFYDRTRTSPFFSMLIEGSIGELIIFLRKFRNKGACGYAHETRMVVDGVLLTPENCMHKTEYIACGHPELNGLLVAVVLSEMLLDHAYPVRRQTARIGVPIYESFTQADTNAAIIYQRTRNEKGSRAIIPIIPEIRSIQRTQGEIAMEELENMAKLLEDAYYYV